MCISWQTAVMRAGLGVSILNCRHFESGIGDLVGEVHRVESECLPWGGRTTVRHSADRLVLRFSRSQS